MYILHYICLVAELNDKVGNTLFYIDTKNNVHIVIPHMCVGKSSNERASIQYSGPYIITPGIGVCYIYRLLMTLQQICYGINVNNKAAKIAGLEKNVMPL